MEGLEKVQDLLVTIEKCAGDGKEEKESGEGVGRS